MVYSGSQFAVVTVHKDRTRYRKLDGEFIFPLQRLPLQASVREQSQDGMD